MIAKSKPSASIFTKRVSGSATSASSLAAASHVRPGAGDKGGTYLLHALSLRDLRGVPTKTFSTRRQVGIFAACLHE